MYDIIKKLRYIIGRMHHFILACHLGNYIFFESCPALSDSTKSIFDEMVKRGLNKKYKLIWWVDDRKDKKLPRIKGVLYVDKNTFINAHIFRFFRFRAKCFICCNQFLHKENPRTKSFYITHGTGIKNIKPKYQAPDDIDFCFVASPSIIEPMSEQFGAPQDKMVALGYPRNDDLTNTTIDIHGILKREFDKIIVWYPTYRQHKYLNSFRGESLPIIHDIEKAERINKHLVEHRIVIVIKPHFAQDISYIKDTKLSNIVFIDDDFFAKHAISSYQFVSNCDALITDYSSIYFDFLLCDKPIGLVWEDINLYRENPGFAIDLDYYMKAGTKIYNENDLVRFIQDIATGNDTLKKERNEINSWANYASDGKNTERVVDFIIQKACL